VSQTNVSQTNVSQTNHPAMSANEDHTDHEPHIRIERGQPSDEELAAVVAVLGSATGGHSEPGPHERNLWGHPVDKLRYAIFSWQRVTLLERTHMRR
jgi:hypothetical protein